MNILKKGRFFITVFILSVCFSSRAVASEVWVDAKNGLDTNNGTLAKPFLSISKGVKAANGAGLHTVHVLPGEYREQVIIDKSHIHIVVDERDRGKAILYASESSQDMAWHKNDPHRLPESARGHVWEADFPGWGEIDPKLGFIILPDGSTKELRLAHEPDWKVTTPWKYHEHWWTVDMDAKEGISSSQLGNLSDLTGGRVWIKDGKSAHNTFGPVIRNQLNNNIRLSFAGGDDTIKKGCTKFYVEGKIQLLDEEGEWCFDASAGKFYIWPPQDTNPKDLHIEFAKRLNGIVIPEPLEGKRTNLTDIIIDGLVVRGANHDNDFYSGPSAAIVVTVDAAGKKISCLTIRNCLIEHNARGIYIWDKGNDETTSVAGMTIEDCEIGYSQGNAISTDSEKRETAAMVNMVIQRCNIHHAGFRNYPTESDSPGINIQYVDGLRFLDNEVHHTGHNGIQIDRRYWNCLVMGNYFWDCGLNGSDEGSIKFHAFHSRDWTGPISTVVAKNIIRGNMGWGYASSRLSWFEGTGLSGAGIYFDISSGGLIYRNLIIDTGYNGIWSANIGTDHIWVFNNTIINCRRGIEILNENTHTRVVNNLFMDPSHARLGFKSDHKAGKAFCGQMWDNNGPGESRYNAYKLDNSNKPICTVYYYDKGKRRRHMLYSTDDIRELGHGFGKGSIDLKGPDNRIINDASNFNAYPAAGSPVIDAGAPLPKAINAILKRVGLRPDVHKGKNRDIGANEYSGGRETVTLSNPDEGEEFFIGDTLNITWSASDFVGLVKILLSRDSGRTWEVIKEGVPASWGKYPWKVSGIATSKAIIRLTDYGSHEYDTSRKTFLLLYDEKQKAQDIPLQNKGQDKGNTDQKTQSRLKPYPQTQSAVYTNYLACYKICFRGYQKPDEGCYVFRPTQSFQRNTPYNSLTVHSFDHRGVYKAGYYTIYGDIELR